MANMARNELFDVAIVGAGPVGLALALALVRSSPPARVVLVDQRVPGTATDRRAVALSAGVSEVFKTLEVWANMARAGSPIAGMRITDSDTGDMFRPLFLNFDGDVAPGKPFAHMVPNRVIIATLAETLADLGVPIVAPARVVEFNQGNRCGRLVLDTGQTVEARLVVAADGGRSAVRGMAGIGTFTHDYGQSGVVATIRHERDHENLAYEHFLPPGPFASLPLPDHCSSLVWTERRDEANRLVQLEQSEIEALIEQRTGSTLGAVRLMEGPQVFPLRLVLARQWTGKRLALAGDAAHVIHPIAGQGLNLGIKDIAALSEVIVNGLRLGEDIGSGAVLERYGNWRRADTLIMASAMHAINLLFSNDSEVLRHLRDVGIGLVDRIDPVKKGLIRRAAAADGGPRLMRGQTI
jgi:2-octaprenyl-6-methoxyphenol hydroxylase